MLVLSRQRKESVVIVFEGRICEVTLCETRGDKARIGFQAPDEVKIYRREVYDAMLRENPPPRAA
jgi:carbon storage regulator